MNDEAMTPDQEAEAAKAAAAQAAADAKAAKAAEKEAAKAAKEAEKARKAEEKAAREATKEAAKVQRVSQNGVTMPAAGTIGSQLWAMFDAKSTEMSRPAKLSEVLDQVKAAGIKESSARAGYAHWRKFYGLTRETTSAAA